MLNCIWDNFNIIFNYITLDFFNDQDLEYIPLLEDMDKFYEVLDPLVIIPLEQFQWSATLKNLNTEKRSSENFLLHTIHMSLEELIIPNEILESVNYELFKDLKGAFDYSSPTLNKLYMTDLNYILNLNLNNELFCLNESNSMLLWEATNNLTNLNIILENLSLFENKNKFLMSTNKIYETSCLKEQLNLKHAPIKLNAYGLWENLFNLEKEKYSNHLFNLKELKILTLEEINKWVHKKF